MKTAWVLLMLTTYDGDERVYANVHDSGLTEEECRDTLEFMARIKAAPGEAIYYVCEQETE
jgi:hypothetical protein